NGAHALLSSHLYTHKGLPTPRRKPQLCNPHAKQSLHRRPRFSTLIADLSDVCLCTSPCLYPSTKGDAHAVDDLCDLVGVVALRPGLLVYPRGLHPSPAGDRGYRPRGAASARAEAIGLGGRETRSL